MIRLTAILILCFLGFQGVAQSPDLNQYSYVMVPDQFRFQNQEDQYKLNSMVKFYLNKHGFNSYLASENPNFKRCAGLYADVEELRTIFGTKLQVILRDCNKQEVYRSPEGKSKLKDYEQSFQDALRRAFTGMNGLNVNQTMDETLDKAPIAQNTASENVIEEEGKVELQKELKNALPSAAYTNYTAGGDTFLLRKTGDGYSLYKEATSKGNDLLLVGKLIIINDHIKFMKSSGEVNEASFANNGTLTIGKGPSSVIYRQTTD